MTMKNSLLISRSGTTLVEVMIALIIIAIVIMGGGMFFFYGRVNIIREAHRRAAVLVASQRLEALKAANYSEISSSEDEYYIKWSGTDWDPSVTSADDAPEPVDVDNLLKGSGPTMITEAEYVADDGGSSHDYLEITVTVNWHDSTDNSVSLTTLIAPR